MNVRKQFLNFFKEKNHNIIPSDSLIPSSDPTLLFSSAGMVQFKKYFLGVQKMNPPRAASSQKCFRTSDLERIGHTPRHLSFFEMLGNFSFGDYFKEDAIAWAWEFLTKNIALPADKLSITIYKDDDEAYEIWKNIVPESKIFRLGEETNFWNMGPTGPCGPCSEIIYDMGVEFKCDSPDCGPGCDCDRWLEVWNLVFTQFDRSESGKLNPLPFKNIDTGMGLERLTVVASNKKSVFETELFTPIIAEAKKIFKTTEIKDSQTPAYRIIADHARAATFLISDGILPANDGRGYVLRRIIRRAARQGKVLGYEKPFLYKLCGKVVEMMKDAYPDLSLKRENIAMIAKMEEEKFLETLNTGIARLDDMISAAQKSGVKALDGKDVFYLYDTFGFPAELTKEILSEKGLIYPQKDYEKARDAAQELAKKSWKGVTAVDTSVYKNLSPVIFAGYDELIAQSTIKGIIIGGKAVTEIKEGQEGEIILVKTSFYGESGGQVGDSGRIYSGNELSADVLDTIKPAEDVITHKVKVTKGAFKTGDTVTSEINVLRRNNIMRHHTATHLLHKALRTVLGEHATQSGSLVGPDGFRFDFTHFKGLAPQELERIEDIVNEKITDCLPVKTLVTTLEHAKQYKPMALFGEKYTGQVRCVYTGEKPETAYSVELCGGTHSHNTGEIGFFKITGESSIGSGLRRIEAVCGPAALLLVRENEAILSQSAEKLKSSVKEIPAKIDSIIQKQKSLEKEIENLRTRPAAQDSKAEELEIRGGIKLTVSSLQDPGLLDKNLRAIADNIKEKNREKRVIFINNVVEDKFSFVVTATKDVIESGFDAGKAAKEFAKLIDGSGGGRQDFAQGGAKKSEKIPAAVKHLSEIIERSFK